MWLSASTTPEVPDLVDEVVGLLARGRSLRRGGSLLGALGGRLDLAAGQRGGERRRAPGAGTLPDRSGRTASATCWLKIEPSAAMPVAMPTWRKVEFTPLAMPARATGTTPTAVDASGGLIIPIPTPGHDQAGDQVGPRGVVADAVEEQQPDPEDQEARRDQPLTGTRSVSRPAIAAAKNEATRQVEEPDAGLDRGVAEHVLHVDHQEGQQREDRCRDAERGDQATGEGRLAQQRQVEHRLALDQLAHHEDHQQDGGRDQRRHDLLVAPAPLAGLDQAVDERAERQREASRSRTSPGDRRRGSLDSATLRQRDGQGHQADRDVDEEDPAPGQAAGEDAAEDRADRDRDAGGRTEDAERRTAVLAVERAGEQRQGGGEHRRAADALEGAREICRKKMSWAAPQAIEPEREDDQADHEERGGGRRGPPAIPR